MEDFKKINKRYPINNKNVLIQYKVNGEIKTTKAFRVKMDNAFYDLSGSKIDIGYVVGYSDTLEYKMGIDVGLDNSDKTALTVTKENKIETIEDLRKYKPTIEPKLNFNNFELTNKLKRKLTNNFKDLKLLNRKRRFILSWWSLFNYDKIKLFYFNLYIKKEINVAFKVAFTNPF